MAWKIGEVQPTVDGPGFVVQNGPQSICFVYSDEVMAKHYAKLMGEAVKDAVKIGINK